jgi:hypothetical protein
MPGLPHVRQRACIWEATRIVLRSRAKYLFVPTLRLPDLATVAALERVTASLANIALLQRRLWAEP